MAILEASHLPRLPHEEPLAQSRLVNIDDSFAGEHQVDQCNCRLLPLHERLEQVGAVVDHFGLLVPKTELVSEDTTDFVELKIVYSVSF